jgi:hypothetical protein
MPEQPSMLKLWLVRVILPAAMIIGIGLLMVRRPPSPVDPDESSGERLHKIGLAINEATARLGRPPGNLDELRPYLREHGDPDRLVVSPVDGQPFVLLWGIDVRSAAYDTVLGYEQIGTGGRRFVLTASTVLQMTDDEFAKVAPLPNNRPPTLP